MKKFLISVAQTLLSAQFHTQHHRLRRQKCLRYYWKSIVHTGVVAIMLCIIFSQTFAQVNPQVASDTTRINFDDLASVQDADKPLYVRYGGYAHYDVAAWNRARFVGFQGINTCCLENHGDSLSLFGTNFSIGALFEYPLFSRFGASLRVGYSQHSSVLRRIEATKTSYAGVPQGTLIDYRLAVNLATLGVEPLLTIRPIDYLAINIGARLDVALSSSYRYEELLTSDNISFIRPNGEATSVWNEQQGAILGRQPLTTSLIAGLSYEAPLNATGTLFLCPELWYSRGLTSLVGGLESRSNGATPVVAAWNQDRLRIGLAFKASPFRTIRPEVTPEMQDKIRQLRRIDSLNSLERERNKVQLAKMDSLNRVITARMEEMKKQGITVNLTKLVGVNSAGEEVPNPTVVVEEVRGEQFITLIPSIFFDNGSSVIPTRYHRLQSAERGTFQTANLAGRTTLEIYREILNIIGKRLTDNVGAVVFLKPQSTSNEAPKVAETRAQAISDYLQDVWKIPARRIVIEKSSNTASSNIPSVELAASMPEILAPVRFADRRLRRATPSTLRFGVEINAGAGLKQWSLEITQFAGDEALTLKEFKGTNKYPSVIDWSFESNDNLDEMPRSSQDMTMQLTMTDITNKNGDAPLQSVPVRQISLEEQERSGIEPKRVLQWDIIGFTAQGELTELGKESVQTAKAALQKAQEQVSNKRSPEVILIIADAAFRQNALNAARELGLTESAIRVRPASSQGNFAQNTSAQQAVIEPSQENKQYRGAVRLEMVY